MQEAELEPTEHGLVRKTSGWFVVNAAEAAWKRHDEFGSYCSFEGEQSFPHYGLNIHVLAPGQPSCMYHREDAQEDFLVLSGTCTLIVEGEERRLGPFDYFHAAPDTEHVFVGTSDAPCAILMVGPRAPDAAICYPVNDTALKHGAGVKEETPEPRVAYAGTPPPTPMKSLWRELVADTHVE